MKVVIITGMSGAGKSLAINCLEDIGFFCVDNLPPKLIPKFAEIAFNSDHKFSNIAVVVDIRGGELLDDLIPVIEQLKINGTPWEILFMEASDQVLVKRYKESRRTHPLAGTDSDLNGIEQERKKLSDIRKKATHIIDTSSLIPGQLKKEIEHIMTAGAEYEGLLINITSFGFKNGLPLDSDLVFDVRFLPNPHYIPSLKKMTGKSEAVKEYVFRHNQTKIFMTKLVDMLEFLIPQYIKEGKTRLIIGIGCTGGRHRSVAISDKLSTRLIENGHRAVTFHRDVVSSNKAEEMR